MNCCARCFRDAEIIDIIKNQKSKGDCDFCDSKNVPVYDLDSDLILAIFSNAQKPRYIE